MIFGHFLKQKKEERKKKKHNGRINKDRTFRDIKTLFETVREKEERKKKKQNKKINWG